MKRVKKPKDNERKYVMSRKQLDKELHEMSKKAVKSAAALVLAATMDTLGLTGEQAKEIQKTADRYAEYISQHIIGSEVPTKYLQRKGIEIKFLPDGEEEQNV